MHTRQRATYGTADHAKGTLLIQPAFLYFSSASASCSAETGVFPSSAAILLCNCEVSSDDESTMKKRLRPCLSRYDDESGTRQNLIACYCVALSAECNLSLTSAGTLFQNVADSCLSLAVAGCCASQLPHARLNYNRTDAGVPALPEKSRGTQEQHRLV